MISFTTPVSDMAEISQHIWQKSIDVLSQSQFESGGTTASLKGSRYAGNVYPRDHAYATRAFITLKDVKRARKALSFILNCPLSDEHLMFQRYNEKGENNSYKPPQIDGNAQSLISLGVYLKETNDQEFWMQNEQKVQDLLTGLDTHTQQFEKGSLVETINGIIEFSPFEKGYDLYTNACTYRAYLEMSEWYKDLDGAKAQELSQKAISIKKGIESYLYFPAYGGFMMGVRPEPDASVVSPANLKSFLALIDFDVFEANDPRIIESLDYHLAGTKNEELGGYNRYARDIGRHNFGNGPWPMVMLRLAHAYSKMNKKNEVTETLSWVFNVARLNEDQWALPEHVSTRLEFEREFEAARIINDVAPRPAKIGEYEHIAQTSMYKSEGIAYAINPLVWSHAQFILVWNSVKSVLY